MAKDIGSPSKPGQPEFEINSLRLTAYLWNNDNRGCGPVQHPINITHFGDWEIIKFVCGGVDRVEAPIPITYSDWNGNFDSWTVPLNGLIDGILDWFNVGRPCHRVMATIACADQTYGDFVVKLIDPVNSKFDQYIDEEVLIQPQPMPGPVLSIRVCIEKTKNGPAVKKFYDMSGDEIPSLIDYVVAEYEHLVEPTTGAPIFTKANILKIYPDDNALCDCLRSAGHEYPEVDATPPCEVQIDEGGCVYDAATEPPTQLHTNVTRVLLVCGDEVRNFQLLLPPGIQENPSDEVELDTIQLGIDNPEWFYDPTCSGLVATKVETYSRCDSVTCTEVDFCRMSDGSTQGPFLPGTDIPADTKGPYIECVPKICFRTECFELEEYRYEWDNGYGGYPLSGTAPTRYNTPHGSVLLFNGNPVAGNVGFIDGFLACGTATIDAIVIDGTNILPAPVVESTTTGAWVALNNLLFDKITEYTEYTTPPGIGCDVPPATPSTNCFGRSVTCDDIPADANGNIGYFDVTDCKGNKWRFSIRKTFVGAKRYLRQWYKDCNGDNQCQWIDEDTKEVVVGLDEKCMKRYLIGQPCGAPMGDCQPYGDSGAAGSEDFDYCLEPTDATEGSFSMNTNTIKWQTSGGLIPSIAFIDNCIAADGIAYIKITDQDGNIVNFDAKSNNSPGASPSTSYSGTGPGGFSGKIRKVEITCPSLAAAGGRACAFIQDDKTIKWFDSKTGAELTAEQCETIGDGACVTICPDCPIENVQIVQCSTEAIDGVVAVGDQILTLAKRDCNGVITESCQYNLSQNQAKIEVAVDTEPCDPDPDIETLENCLLDSEGKEWTQIIIFDPDDPLSTSEIFYDKDLVPGTPAGDPKEWKPCPNDSGLVDVEKVCFEWFGEQYNGYAFAYSDGEIQVGTTLNVESAIVGANIFCCDDCYYVFGCRDGRLAWPAGSEVVMSNGDVLDISGLRYSQVGQLIVDTYGGQFSGPSLGGPSGPNFSQCQGSSQHELQFINLPVAITSIDELDYYGEFGRCNSVDSQQLAKLCELVDLWKKDPLGETVETCDYAVDWKSSGIDTIVTDKGTITITPPNNQFTGALAPPPGSPSAEQTAAQAEIQAWLDANGGGTVVLEYISTSILEIRITGSTCEFISADHTSNPGPHSFTKTGGANQRGFAVTSSTDESVTVANDKSAAFATGDTVSLASSEGTQIAQRTVTSATVEQVSKESKETQTVLALSSPVTSKVAVSRVALESVATKEAATKQ